MITIGFTRPSIRLADSVSEAESMGFRVLAAPSMEISHGDPEQFRRTEEMLTSGRTDFAVFGSVTSVEECVKEYGAGFAPMFRGVRIVSIGPSTSLALSGAGLVPDMVPADYSSYGIVDMLKDSVNGKRIAVLRSDRGSPVIRKGLTESGAEVTDIAVYRLTPCGGSDDLVRLMTAVRDGSLDVMCFTSPLSAVSFFDSMSDAFGKTEADACMKKVSVAAIGRPTSEALTGLGRAPDIVPDNTTFRDMLLEIKKRF